MVWHRMSYFHPSLHRNCTQIFWGCKSTWGASFLSVLSTEAAVAQSLMRQGASPGTKLLTGNALFFLRGGCSWCLMLLWYILSCSRALFALCCRNLVLACRRGCLHRLEEWHRAGKWAVHRQGDAQWQPGSCCAIPLPLHWLCSSNR